LANDYRGVEDSSLHRL